MSPELMIFWLSLLPPFITGQDLPTLYEYYTSDGIKSGLSANRSTNFLLNGKNFSIYSGSMHYFRVPRAYWRDRLKKLRAAGLNTVETYIAWNIHEPENGLFEFGESSSEMEDFAHIEEFLKTAQQEDLFVILRPGPYINADYNFGGFPSWLLREDNLTYRTTEETFIKYVSRYYDNLLPILEKYQFTKGGSVILFQIENEYGNQNNPDKEYLMDLRQIFLNHGIVEPLATSDDILRSEDRGTIPDLFLQTANFGSQPEDHLKKLRELQPDKPLFVMQYFIGWYDSWGDNRSTVNLENKTNTLEGILKFPASVNIYMFHGGTNFGFTNGASSGNTSNLELEPYTTSYDYLAPLTEGGDYTDQYFNIKELIEKYNPVKTLTPDIPRLESKIAYPAISIEKEILLKDILEQEAPYVIESEEVISMEKLDINNKSGQSNGYIHYRKDDLNWTANPAVTIGGRICDVAVISLNGMRFSANLDSKADFTKFGFWRVEYPTFSVKYDAVESGGTLDILVENWGRISSGREEHYTKSFKGLWRDSVFVNNKRLKNWKIFPLEFKKEWVNNLTAWTTKTSSDGPALYRAVLEITDDPKDTCIDMRGWSKGLVVVNGFSLGKYSKIGPQQSLYLPAPFLKKGSNEIVVFEQFRGTDRLTFAMQPIWQTP